MVWQSIPLMPIDLVTICRSLEVSHLKILMHSKILSLLKLIFKIKTNSSWKLEIWCKKFYEIESEFEIFGVIKSCTSPILPLGGNSLLSSAVSHPYLPSCLCVHSGVVFYVLRHLNWDHDISHHNNILSIIVTCSPSFRDVAFPSMHKHLNWILLILAFCIECLREIRSTCPYDFP